MGTSLRLVLGFVCVLASMLVMSVLIVTASMIVYACDDCVHVCDECASLIVMIVCL